MKDRQNNYAFIANELITIIVVCLVLFIIIAIMIYQSSNSEKFHIMKYNATNMATSITSYNVSDNLDGIYYLQELIDNKIHSEVKSPFNAASKCSETESFVRIEAYKKYVTLKCGAYLIDNQYIGEPTFTIYKVSDWSIKKPESKHIEERIKYNYVDNYRNVYDEYYDAEVFLYFLNRDKKTNYNTIEEAIDHEKVVTKTFYREKEVFIKNQK